MTNEEKVIELVSEGPIKAIDLIAKLTKYDPQIHWIDILELMADEGKILEIQYVLSSMDYRAKSIYFPKGTKIDVSIHRRRQELGADIQIQ